VVEKGLWGGSCSLVFLFEDLLHDVLTLLKQVFNVFLDFGLVFGLEAFKDIFDVSLAFFDF
jgi:hypothetical protein